MKMNKKSLGKALAILLAIISVFYIISGIALSTGFWLDKQTWLAFHKAMLIPFAFLVLFHAYIAIKEKKK